MAKYDSVSKQINALEGDEDGTLGNELKMKLIQKLTATKKFYRGEDRGGWRQQ